MPCTLLDTSTRVEVEDIENCVLAPASNVPPLRRDIDTGEPHLVVELKATHRVGVVNIPEKNLAICAGRYYLVLPILALRQACDIAVLRDMLNERLVQLEVICYYQLVITSGVYNVGRDVVNGQRCH